MIDETHDPKRASWVAGADGHRHFPVQNLPYGIFSSPGEGIRAGVAIGDHILDLKAATKLGLLPEEAVTALQGTSLNALMALPADARIALRQRLSFLLSNEEQRRAVEKLLHGVAGCKLHLPATIGDYTDFYVGIHHATNVGRQFRPDNPLLPNYKHVPIGYHGRASSVCASGVPVRRPSGQRKPPNADTPSFGPSRRLDFELELGLWIGAGNMLGQPIPIGQARDHIAGLCLLNDWSARELQAWEYQPLGPFLAKSFHTTISPWVVTTEALEPFRIAQPARDADDPKPLPYLWDEADQASGAYAIALEVQMSTARMRAAGEGAVRISRSRADVMYWTMAQIVAHHASGGCNLRPGDLLGTGTLSAPTPDGYGSLLEMTQGGTVPLDLITGEQRTFLEDGDEVILTAKAEAHGYVSIGFGEARGEILPAF